MTTIKRNPFDVTVEGVSSRVLSMVEIMDCYKVYLAQKNYEKAKIVLEYGVQCANIPARLELARFLRGTPQLNMTQKARFTQSETLYRELINTMDIPDRLVAQLSMELATLCDLQNRPVGYLGGMLRAKRLGYSVQDKDIEICKRRLKREDIHSLGRNSQDCLDLGYELYIAGNFKYAEMFLREASESKDFRQAGPAALWLAELYLEHSADCNNHRMEAYKLYHLAAQKGFPEYLTATSILNSHYFIQR